MIRRTIVAAIAAVALVGASEASAQTIGFKLGASFAKWNVEVDGQDANANSGTLTSFMGGGFVRFGLGRIGIQPELLVVTRGAELDDPFGTNEDGKIKVDYIEVPVLLILPLTMGSGIAPYVFGGPDFAFEIGCSFEQAGSDNEVDCGDTGNRKSTDIGVTAGAGLAFPMGPGELLIEGRYNWGLSNLVENPVGGESTKSRTAAVLAGYSIWLGQR